jgi:hypothetical protein
MCTPVGYELWRDIYSVIPLKFVILSAAKNPYGVSGRKRSAILRQNEVGNYQGPSL